jgi:glycosyltransferase involved in cell wall biosynthesis
LLPSLDLFVQSSLTEGMPNVLLEAGGAGIPIVATSVGGTPEIVTDRESGRLVKARNSKALALTIIEMLTNPEDRKRYQANAKVNVESKFGFQSQAMSYMNLFTELGIKV